MTRELLWDSFIEILIYILPLVNYHKIKRSLNHVNPFHKKLIRSTSTVALLTITTKCPHCNEFPILPHSMGCAHIFCYSCLKGNQVADPKYECPLCSYCSDSSACNRVT
ncbi:hypothetical protein Trydic_g15477 [Trypoxylus dichotomus]